MTTFQEARAFLLKHRTDYDAAVKGFRWPDPVPFNWALDWFDAELARDPASRDRPALWIVDAASHRASRDATTATAAGVTPGTRDACPSVVGLITESRSITSRDNVSTACTCSRVRSMSSSCVLSAAPLAAMA